jgi:hypothetical protein
VKLVAVALLAIAGCATIDMHTPPPANWPLKGEPRIVDASWGQVIDCLGGGFSAAVMLPIACTCLYLSPAFSWGAVYTITRDPAVLEHERLHYQGYNHPGDSMTHELMAATQSGEGTMRSAFCLAEALKARAQSSQ